MILSPGVAAIMFVAVLLLSRWPFQPPVFLTFDNVNFALALERFNPFEHRPQPPGYPLFVDLAHVINWFVDDVHVVFFLAGIAGAFVGVWMTWRLGSAVAGPAAGMAAAFLLIVHPSLWNANLMNPVRTWLAGGSATIAWFAWQCWTREGDHPKAWLTAWFALGVAAGFRPGLAIFLLPLLLVAGYRRRTSLSGWLAAGACVTAGVLPWFLQAVLAVGGVGKYVFLLRTYLEDQSETTSVVYGGSLVPALTMAGRAMAWIFVGAAGWIWYARNRRIPQPLFFAVWFLPAFLFLTIVHSAEPGHVLSLAPPLCIVGGWVVANLRWSQRAIAVLLPAALFFLPPKGPLRVSSLKGAQLAERRVTLALNDIRNAKLPVIRVSDDSPVAWRVVSYYFPEMTVLVPVGNHIWHIRNNVLVQSLPVNAYKTAEIAQLDSRGLHTNQRAGVDPRTAP